MAMTIKEMTMKLDEFNKKYKIRRHFEYVTGADRSIPLPSRKTKGSVGYDFYLPVDVTVPARGHTGIIKTGVKVYMPEDEWLQLHIRSSIGLLKNVMLCNCTGIIDSDYVDNEENEGEIGLALLNNSDEDIVFHKGDRIMQGVFTKYSVVDDDEVRDERKGGTGSTGK